MRKRLIMTIVLILSVAVMMGVTACGNMADEDVKDAGGNTADSDAGAEIVILDMEDDEPYCILPGDCDSRGYLGLICDETGEYTFSAVNGDEDELTWEVYVMDEKYPDASRYISESETPVLTGDGTLSINEGQYIYVSCSANTFTSEDGELPVDSYLEIRLNDNDD